MTTITTAELLDALATASDAPDGARSVVELMAETGMGERRVRAGLHALHAAGRLVIHRARRIDLSGRPQHVPVYTILPAKKAKR